MMISARETRRRRLVLLVSEFEGQSALAERLGRERNQIWQWTLPEDDPRGRGISPKMARKIESLTNKPEGWMDQPLSGAQDSPVGADSVGKTPAAAPQALRRDADILRTAMGITDRAIAHANASATAEARAEITLAIYDLIQEGHGMEAAERIVTSMLRALGGLTTPGA